VHPYAGGTGPRRSRPESGPPRQNGRVSDLQEDWAATVRAAGATADDDAVAAAGADLLGRWQQPHRHYHDAEHLAEVLAAIDDLAGDAADACAVRLAAWFHDAIYEGRPGDDEQRSADLAREVLTGLGVPAQRTDHVADLVRVTLHHDPAPDDADAAVLCDADLAVLGADADRYGRYVRAVRAEYGHVPEPMFRTGREMVLKALDAMPRLYRTAAARQRWEEAARANLARELGELGEQEA
jgi:predicted metal-dependent HD superfamily phosphohydrolase